MRYIIEKISDVWGPRTSSCNEIRANACVRIVRTTRNTCHALSRLLWLQYCWKVYVISCVCRLKGLFLLWMGSEPSVNRPAHRALALFLWPGGESAKALKQGVLLPLSLCRWREQRWECPSRSEWWTTDALVQSNLQVKTHFFCINTRGNGSFCFSFFVSEVHHSALYSAVGGSLVLRLIWTKIPQNAGD